ncbi:MAG: iron-sulfur cluster assembly scaffold protein [Candidatus Micrarchaeia archaeon]
MKRFLKPKHAGELKAADGIGTVGNPVCGDKMTVYLRVKAGRVSEIKFRTFGCAAAIATSDMVCDLALGKTLAEAKRITRASVSGALGSLPPIKEHCSNLAADALHAAVADYESRIKGAATPSPRRSRIRLSCKGGCKACARCRAPSSPQGSVRRRTVSKR